MLRLKMPLTRIARDLIRETSSDNVTSGAAALAYYLMLSIFPALIFLLTLLPYLPVANLKEAVMQLLNEAMPGQAAALLSGTVESVVSERRGRLLSVGAVGALWAASSGMQAVMQQLNVAYDVVEQRSYVRVRALALLLTFLFGGLVVAAFALIVMGGYLEDWLGAWLGFGVVLRDVFAVVRWLIIVFGLSLGFACAYYFGPSVRQPFQWVSPGSVLGVVLLVAASLAIRLYVDHFNDYSATYGSLGAVIILLLWLYVAGLVLLVGGEVNALLRRYAGDRVP